MSPDVQATRKDEAAGTVNGERAGLRVAGALMAGGWLATMVATFFHPGGAEDDHEVIFAKYAESDAWVAVHLVQFVGVLVAMAGLLVLYRFLGGGGRPPLLAQLAAAATVATAAIWAVL